MRVLVEERRARRSGSRQDRFFVGPAGLRSLRQRVISNSE